MPTVQCSGRWLSVLRACRFAWMAPTCVASKSSVASWQRDRQGPWAVVAPLSSVGGIPHIVDTHTHTHTHGVHRRIRQESKEEQCVVTEGYADGRRAQSVMSGSPAASVARPNRAGGVDDLLLASCPFPVRLGNPRLLK